jgi:hypothetical protein
MQIKPGIAAWVALPAAVLATSLGGCASSFNFGDPFESPQKFHYLRCQDIAQRMVGTKAREQELRTLMDRSSAGTGGSVVNMFAYEPEFRQVQADLKQLREAAVEKQCPPEPAKPDAKKEDPKKPHA